MKEGAGVTVNCFGGKKRRLGKRPCLALSPSTQTLGRRKEAPVRHCRAAEETGHLIFGTIVGVALAGSGRQMFHSLEHGVQRNCVGRNTAYKVGMSEEDSEGSSHAQDTSIKNKGSQPLPPPPLESPAQPILASPAQTRRNGPQLASYGTPTQGGTTGDQVEANNANLSSRRPYPTEAYADR